MRLSSCPIGPRSNLLAACLLVAAPVAGIAQDRPPAMGGSERPASLAATKADIAALTSPWRGERSSDGRPRVADDLLKRVRAVSIEEAWDVLRLKGYGNQFVDGWQMLHPDRPFAGRALTAGYLPARPDLVAQVNADGKAAGRVGPSNSWPIDMLQPGDVYIADGYGKVNEGTLIGDNLGNAIYAKSGNGVVFDAGARDIEGLQQIAGFNAFVRGWHPSFLKDSTLAAINRPIRIGGATVLPGDVVLAKREGVVIIPAHLVEEVVVTAEVVALKDEFGHARLRAGVYAPGQIDIPWTEPIKADFYKWLDARPDKSRLTPAEIDKHL